MALFDSIFSLLFQEAYAFWTCSTHLPMWLLDYDSERSVEVEACRSTCLMVEKRCPFLIKGTEDDMASGNPSFMCKGKGKEKNLTKVGRRRSSAQLPSLFFVNALFIIDFSVNATILWLPRKPPPKRLRLVVSLWPSRPPPRGGAQ